ncbi:glutamine synthetase [Natranaerobius trueperi]|uniref:glutamine synthetase n=1 Tax=Natranaerobius trueperi TaxID=759412 RepID=UPI00117CFEB4|nr:glutamine synthetase [Natranaerobius trueperi]
MKREEIMAEVKDKNVEFIRLQFTDITGVLKNVALTVSGLSSHAFNRGMKAFF